MWSRLPNAITIFRIAIIPVFLWVYLSPLEHANWISMLLFIMAGISDGVDGYVARRWQIESSFGRFLDPVADKLIVMAAILVMVAEYMHWLYVAAAFILVGRDFLISALREWVGTNTMVLGVSIWGKWKTFIQFWALSFLILGETVWGIDFVMLGNAALVVAVFLSVFSLYLYVQSFLRQL